MLRYHMAVISPDTRLKREIKRVTTATGASADFVREHAAFEAGSVDLVIYDARESTPPPGLLSGLRPDSRITYILESEHLLRRLDLLGDERVTSLMCRDEQFDDDEFIASATKALRGELFGLQKYFPWGVTTYSMIVKNYTERERAMAMVMEYAQLAGVRGGIRQRIQLVCDELTLNALYHAPRDDSGEERFRHLSHKEMRAIPELPPIQVQYGCSGRYFGISVRDGAGSLTRPRLLRYVERARDETMAVEQKTTGAGLGIASVVRSVSKLVFNLIPTESTEVIALFDMDLMAKGKLGARSLHVFSAEPEPEVEPEPPPDRDRGGSGRVAPGPGGADGGARPAVSDGGAEAALPAGGDAVVSDDFGAYTLSRSSGSPWGAWILATLLLMATAALTTYYLLQQ